MTWIEIHGRLANTALLYTGIMALWGFWRYFRRQGVESSYWGALVIAELLYVFQGSLGAFIWLSGAGVPARGGIHVLYGVVSLITLPGVFFYTRGESNRRAMLVYAAALLFLVGIVLRSMSTGG